MASVNTQPTLAGFQLFCTNVVGVPVDDTPSDTALQTALDYAQQWVPIELSCIPGGPSTNSTTNSLYVTAVYNWAASLMIQFAQDQSGQVFFTDLRKSFAISNFVAGPISSDSNEATSVTMELGAGMKNLTFVDMQRAKDPYGRAALEIMMSAGGLWGLS
jgi:hypothetical protein